MANKQLKNDEIPNHNPCHHLPCGVWQPAEKECYNTKSKGESLDSPFFVNQYSHSL